MRDETMIDAINDIDNIRCMVEDIREAVCADPDYWEKLKHQYAGMAMQAILSSNVMMEILSRRDNGTMEDEVAMEALDYATALVEKLKSEK